MTTEQAISEQSFRSPARKEGIIRELAMGQKTHREIAMRFGVTKQYVGRLSMDNKERIEELHAMVEEKVNELWVMDAYERAKERLMDIEELNEELHFHKAEAAAFARRMDKDGEPVGEQYYKAMDAKHKIMRQLEESSGQLPTRSAPTPDHGKATYEIPGVDLGEVVKGWDQQPSEVLK